MLYPPPPQKRSVVAKAYFLSNFFSLRDHALLHKGLFFERPITGPIDIALDLWGDNGHSYDMWPLCLIRFFL